MHGLGDQSDDRCYVSWYLVCCSGTSGYAGSYGGAHGSGPGGPPPASIKLKDCSTAELLEHLPKMQRLTGCLAVCVPEGAAASHPVIWWVTL